MQGASTPSSHFQLYGISIVGSQKMDWGTPLKRDRGGIVLRLFPRISVCGRVIVRVEKGPPRSSTSQPLPLAGKRVEWLAGRMMNAETSPEQPLDDHLEEDISAGADAAAEERADFSPGQTNAGQQVGGLMGAIQGPEDEVQGTGNNPI